MVVRLGLRYFSPNRASSILSSQVWPGLLSQLLDQLQHVAIGIAEKGDAQRLEVGRLTQHLDPCAHQFLKRGVRVRDMQRDMVYAGAFVESMRSGLAAGRILPDQLYLRAADVDENNAGVIPAPGYGEAQRP